MQRVRNILGRILFSRKRRGSLLAPHSNDELTPESQSRDAKAAEIHSTGGACFEHMDFDSADEFVHLLQLALDYDAPIFTLEDPTAALIRKYGHQLHPGRSAASSTTPTSWTSPAATSTAPPWSGR